MNRRTIVLSLVLILTCISINSQAQPSRGVWSQRTVDLEIILITQKAQECIASKTKNSPECIDFRELNYYVFGDDARKWLEYNFEKNYINSSNVGMANKMIEDATKALKIGH